MSNADILLYGEHLAFWASFGLTRILIRFPELPMAETGPPVAQREHTARFSLAMLAVHAVAFMVLYLGIAHAIRSNRVPSWFAGQRVVAGVLIGLGIVLVSWALAFLRSWRLRAKIAPGHQLTTDGPFQFLRHPIYGLEPPGARFRILGAHCHGVGGVHSRCHRQRPSRPRRGRRSRARVRQRLCRLLRPHQALHSRRLLSASNGDGPCTTCW